MHFLAILKDKYKNLDKPVFFIILFTVISRLLLLGMKPLHHDEGVNGWFSEHILFNGLYEYDPKNYHGPIIFYPILILHILFGRHNWILRFPSAVVGILCVILILKFSKFLGRRVALLAGLCFALSPANLFYSRYVSFDIHLVFFALLLFYGILGLWHEGLKKNIYIIAISIAGFIITKETFIIYIPCILIALFCLYSLEQFSPSIESPKAPKSWSNSDIYKASLLVLLIVYFSYSGGFLDPFGFFKLFSSLNIWAETGVKETGHAKDYWYWIRMFLSYELPAAIGLCLSTLYIFKSNKWIRFMAIYGVGIFIAQSIVPYKTPWIILNMLWPFYFVLGDMADRFLNSQYRVYIISGLTLSLMTSLILSIRLNFFQYDNQKEPYVYVHTFRSINKLVNPLLKLAKSNPENYGLVGHIIRENYWPLPYILGDFYNVGFYDPGLHPNDYDGDFLFVQSSRVFEVEAFLTKKYFTEIFQMRDSQDPSKLYLSYEKFKDLFPKRNPEFIGHTNTNTNDGLLTKIYLNQNWSGEPAFIKHFKIINLRWEGDQRTLPAPCSIEFTGKINVISPSSKYILITDDGGSVEIDSEKIIDDPGPHSYSEKEGIYYGTPGWKNLKVKFYDLGGGAIVNLLKVDENGNKQFVPPEELRYGE